MFHQKKLPILSSQTQYFQNYDHHCLWIGHATFLINLGGHTILTDPVFGNATFLFRRIVAPGITIDQLPRINYVLISHNHRDHMDAASIYKIVQNNPQVTFLVPQGVKSWFLRHGIERVHEYVWWDAYEINGLRCTFLPAYHWSGRWFNDRNRSLWGSWMIEHNGLTAYFAGDTAYWKHFSCIGHYFSIDIAFLPIGPCKPFSYMQSLHLNASSAVQAFLDLHARRFVAMHWGTFHFGTDDFYTPVTYLERAWRNKKSSSMHELTILKPGQTTVIDRKRTSPVSSEQQKSS